MMCWYSSTLFHSLFCNMGYDTLHWYHDPFMSHDLWWRKRWAGVLGHLCGSWRHWGGEENAEPAGIKVIAKLRKRFRMAHPSVEEGKTDCHVGEVSEGGWWEPPPGDSSGETRWPWDLPIASISDTKITMAPLTAPNSTQHLKNDYCAIFIH